MNERDETRLRDMLDEARRANKFAKGRTRDDLDDNDMLAYALARAIEIIGEAATNVSAETRSQYPQINWKDITGMRNIIVHDYVHLDFDVIWQVASQRSVELIRQLEAILNEA